MSIGFVKRDKLAQADAIVTLTGNGWERTKFAIQLYHQKWAPFFVTVGSTGSRPSPEMAGLAGQRGVPEEKIIIENRSRNTRQNAENAIKIARDRGWKSVILVTSPQHQLRAHLTFKKAGADLGYSLKVINYPVTGYSWFDRVEGSRDPNKTYFRFWYIFSELYRIIKYRLKGDL